VSASKANDILPKVKVIDEKTHPLLKRAEMQEEVENPETLVKDDKE